MEGRQIEEVVASKLSIYCLFIKYDKKHDKGEQVNSSFCIYLFSMNNVH